MREQQQNNNVIVNHNGINCNTGKMLNAYTLQPSPSPQNGKDAIDWTMSKRMTQTQVNCNDN